MMAVIITVVVILLLLDAMSKMNPPPDNKADISGTRTGEHRGPSQYPTTLGEITPRPTVRIGNTARTDRQKACVRQEAPGAARARDSSSLRPDAPSTRVRSVCSRAEPGSGHASVQNRTAKMRKLPSPTLEAAGCPETESGLRRQWDDDDAWCGICGASLRNGRHCCKAGTLKYIDAAHRRASDQEDPLGPPEERCLPLDGSIGERLEFAEELSADLEEDDFRSSSVTRDGRQCP